ncbi:unnamed protein product [Aphanomyces euteiches]
MAGDASSPLETAFETACRERKEKFDMTEKEQQSFLKAMKDPEFRSLLNEYMQEISDPQHRAEQEMYLRQLENENKVPTDKQLVLPKPGFVVKTKYKQKKMFINICSSDKMQPPSSTRIAATTSTAAGTSWNLPYCVGPQRMEQDKGGQAVMTFDVCHHPQTLSRGMESAAFLKMLVNTSIDGVDKALLQLDPSAEKVAREYHILKGVVYKSGNPITMCISKPRETLASNATESQQPPSTTTKKPLIEEITSMPTEPKAAEQERPPVLRKISHQIVERGRFDLADHVESREAAPFRPRELVVKMPFPTHSSAAGIDLDVSSSEIKVTAKGYEPFELKLPYPVIESKGKAKFDKASKTLVVTLPVEPLPVPPPSTKCPQESLQLTEPDVQDEAKKEEDVETVAETEATKAEAPVDHSRWIERQDNQATDEFVAFREYALMRVHDKPPPRSFEEPPFTVQETATNLSYIIQVASIDPESISTSETDTSIMFEFQDGKKWFRFGIENASVAEWPYDLATNNMAIICRKCLIEEKSHSTLEPPVRIHEDTNAISILIDVASIDPETIKSAFTDHSCTIAFSTMQEKNDFEWTKTFSQSLAPNECKVECAQDNLLVILRLEKPEDEKTIELSEPTTSESPVVVPRFTNALIIFYFWMNLEEQLAHLQWRKVCNQSQIQGALKQTKQLHDKDVLLNATEGKNRAKWIKQVVQDEMTKPVEIPDVIVEAMSKETELENQALERSAAVHAASVASIQAKIREREQLVKRHKMFRKTKQKMLSSMN